VNLIVCELTSEFLKMREKSLIKDLTTKVTVTTKIQFFLNTKRKSFK
jgi:peroxiredoxin family protein